MLKERTNQGGSVLVFIIVGVVLLAGLGTAVYYTANINKNPDNTVTVEDSGVGTDENAAEANDNADSSTDTSTDSTTDDTVAVNGDLPVSGPGDVLLTVLGLAGVSFAVFSYLGSRRQLTRDN